MSKKTREKKGHVYSKLHPKKGYAVPAQVLCSLVNLDENQSMTAAEYQWPSDSMGSFSIKTISRLTGGRCTHLEKTCFTVR